VEAVVVVAVVVVAVAVVGVAVVVLVVAVAAAVVAAVVFPAAPLFVFAGFRSHPFCLPSSVKGQSLLSLCSFA